MKKTIVFLLLLNSFYLFSFGQKDLSGIYFTESGMKIEIRGDKFKYIEPHFELPVWCNDTLAECTFKWIDANFIELNSTPPHLIAYKGLRVVQFLDSIVKDSIKVSFSIPSQNRIKVSVTTNTFKTFDLNYSRNCREIMLPNGTKSITFSISPGPYLTPHDADGSYYGVLCFSSIEYTIEKNINHIEIEIPAIDDAFFEKYYVKRDYAKVSKDIIMWKGKVFVRKK